MNKIFLISLTKKYKVVQNHDDADAISSSLTEVSRAGSKHYSNWLVVLFLPYRSETVPECPLEKKIMVSHVLSL